MLFRAQICGDNFEVCLLSVWPEDSCWTWTVTTRPQISLSTEKIIFNRAKLVWEDEWQRLRLQQMYRKNILFSFQNTLRVGSCFGQLKFLLDFEFQDKLWKIPLCSLVFQASGDLLCACWRTHLCFVSDLYTEFFFYGLRRRTVDLLMSYAVVFQQCIESSLILIPWKISRYPASTTVLSDINLGQHSSRYPASTTLLLDSDLDIQQWAAYVHWVLLVLNKKM